MHILLYAKMNKNTRSLLTLGSVSFEIQKHLSVGEGLSCRTEIGKQ